MLLLIGGWIDQLARTPDGWRITRHTGRAVWFDGNDLDVVPGDRRPTKQPKSCTRMQL